MVYTHYGGIQKEKRSKIPTLIAIALGILLVLSLIAFQRAFATPSSGPGDVRINVNSSTWVSNYPTGPGLLPVDGAGQVNGGFSTAERNGIQLALRAQQRGVGPVTPVPSDNEKVGIYNVSTGADPNSLGNRAWWNFDWSVDLRNARGVYAGKTMGDYTLTLTSNMWGNMSINPSAFKPYSANTILYQESANPGYVPGFNMNNENTYDLRLSLKPKTFNGPELAILITVNAQN